MTTGIVRDQKNMEKQMGGCMAGFFNIFDRHQNFTGKRHLATKRLPPFALPVEPSSESEKTSPRESKEEGQNRSVASPDQRNQSQSPEVRSPAPETLTRSPLPLPFFEFKEGGTRPRPSPSPSPWWFSKEAPRLSLDSRAVVDAKGSLKPWDIRITSTASSSEEEEKHRRSPSVIARLMGLDRLPSSETESNQKAELRRSASESRANRHQLISGVDFQSSDHNTASTVLRDQKNQINKNRNGITEQQRAADQREFSMRRAAARVDPARTCLPSPPYRGMVVRKAYFDSADFFPEPPKQSVSTIHGEIEKRLKMRGIDEPSKDLEKLKQILEALQLKGLLHPNRPWNRNLVHDCRSFSHEVSPIVVVRPAKSSPVQPNRVGRAGDDSTMSGSRSRTGLRRTTGEVSPAVGTRRDRAKGQRQSMSSPARSGFVVKSPSQMTTLTVETPRRVKETREQSRVSSPIRSPTIGSRRTGLYQTAGVDRSPSRNPRPMVEIRQKEEDKTFNIPAEDELSSTVSESSIRTWSPTHSERSKTDDFKEGRSLLERCGKLLNSIAEMTATATELQPSPVSVLDSSFYKEASPSPILKRSLDFKEQPSESEDEMCFSAISSADSKSDDRFDDSDYIYISDIFRASNYLPGGSDIFSLIEKQQYLKGKDTSKVSRLERKLVFDTINEILDRKRKLPPWKSTVSCRDVSFKQVWSEFQKIKERDESEDLFEAICCVLRKDLAGDEINGWGDRHVEVSDAVLDIERLIFKDLVGETIRDLLAFAGTLSLPRRKLVF